MATCTAPQDDGRLGALLSDERFLPKILEYLVQDGLHECRRVNRQWRDACSKLPVKLVLDTREDIFKAAKIFPNVVALLKTSNTSHHSWWEVNDFGDQLTKTLGTMKNMKALDIKDAFKWWRPASPEPLFQALTRLESLSFRFFNDRATTARMISALQYLTNLTSLTIKGSASGCDWVVVDVEPLVQLSRLRVLDAEQISLTTVDGRPLFPSRSIARLATVYMPHFSSFSDRWTDAICQYAPSLQSLDLKLLCAAYDRPLELDFLANFSQLEMVELDLQIYTCPNAFGVLNDLRCALKLKIHSLFFDGESHVVQSLFSLTNLQSLEILSQTGCLSGKLPYNNLTQLTKLVTGLPWGGADLTRLKNLVDLRMELTETGMKELAASLPCLTRLEVLAVECLATSVTALKPNLSRLQRLKKLSILNAWGEEGILKAAVILQELEDLSFHCWLEQGASCSFLSQLNWFQSLRRLSLGISYFGPLATEIPSWPPTIEPTIMNHLSHIYKGSLPRLRYLELAPAYFLSPDDEWEIYNRFPSLRALYVDDKLKRFCSM